MNDLMQILVLLDFCKWLNCSLRQILVYLKQGCKHLHTQMKTTKNSPQKREKKDCLENSQQVHKTRLALVFFFSHSFTDFPLIFSTGSPKGPLLLLFTSLFSACPSAVYLQTILTTVSAHSSKPLFSDPSSSAYTEI